MICEKCGFEADDDSLFCPKCGEKLVDVYSFELERTEPSVDIFSYEQTLKEQPAEQESEQNSVMISGEKIFEMLDREYEKIKKQQAEQSVQESTNQLVSEPATIPPVNTQAFVGKGKKIKHNSPAEKRVASSRADQAFNPVEREITRLFKDFIYILKSDIQDAKNRKLKMQKRNELKKEHKLFSRKLNNNITYLKSIEQFIGTFGGKEKLMIDSCAQLWNMFESSLTEFDNMLTELHGVFKMGAIGQTEASNRITQTDKLVSSIETSLDKIISIHKAMSAEISEFDFNSKMFIKALDKNQKTGSSKQDGGSRFSYSNILCIVLIIVSLVLFFKLRTVLELNRPGDHAGLFCFCCTPIGFYHLFYTEKMHEWIVGSLETIKSLWFLIFIPPILAIFCIPGIFALVFCIGGGALIGWIFIIVDPIKIILGYQCINDID